MFALTGVDLYGPHWFFREADKGFLRFFDALDRTLREHGMMPPEQFIWVPARLAYDMCTRPSSLTCTVEVPPSAEVSYVGAPAHD